jgi:hypothetical protein
MDEVRASVNECRVAGIIGPHNWGGGWYLYSIAECSVLASVYFRLIGMTTS